MTIPEGPPPPAPEEGTPVAEHPFLRGLPAAILGPIAEAARPDRFEVGRLLAREGAPAEEFFLIRSGKVALELAGPGRPHVTLQTLGPGDPLGWSWLLPGNRWRFDARALRETAVWRVAGAPVRTALAEHPADGYGFLLRFLPVLADRLEHARLQLGDLYAP